MCIELTLKEKCTKVQVMKTAIVLFQGEKDHGKGSEVVLLNGESICVEECPSTIHGLIHQP